MEHDVIVTTTDAEPNFQALRAMLSDKPAEVPATEPEIVAEPEKVADDVKPEAASEPADKVAEPEAIDEELPEGVKKRIAKEAEKQARIQSEINRAVSARKAKEDELKQLSGSEPAKNTETKPSDGRPVRPKPDAYNTWGEYLAADEQYAAAHETWLVTETRKAAQQEFSAAQQKAEDSRAWAEASKTHSDLPQMAETVVATAPEHLQLAISALDNWAGVTVHLGKNPGELEALVQKFNSNPYLGVAELGKLDARLTTDSKQVEPPKAEKPLPAPLKPVAGSASASKPNVDLEKADDKTFMAELRSMSRLAKKAS